MSWKLSTQQDVSYEVIIDTELFDDHNCQLSDVLGNRVLVFIDDTVSDLYFGRIISYFDARKIDAKYVTVKGDESEKNLEALLLILREIENFGVDRRNEPVLAIGGGVVCDVVGLAAALYRRGIPYVRIPTTLLGMVDVSVAAKVAINWEDRRNRLGAYYPPDYTFIDTNFLPTVDPTDISSGMGEIFKIALIKDKELFHILEGEGRRLLHNKFGDEVGKEVIGKACEDMLEELEPNLWEKNLKRCVDFGHSFSPIIEMRSLTNPNVDTLTHGQAVTLDCIFSSVLAMRRGLFYEINLERVIRTAHIMDLPVRHPSFFDSLLLYESLQDTTKHRNGNQNLPVPVGIGEYTFLNDVTYNEIVETIEEYRRQTSWVHQGLL